MNWKKLLITLLRVAIGWHFLFEGMSKIMAGNWTAFSYLANTTGFLSGIYHFLASSPGLLKVVDLMNMYGLLLIGLALFAGVFIRYAALGGVLLLALYYFAYPPFGASLFRGSEGNLYIVDKNFVEALALVLLAFIREKGYGIYALRDLMKRKKQVVPAMRSEPENENQSVLVNSRREALKNLATLPVLGVMGWSAIIRQKRYGIDVMSGATIQVNSTALSELKGTLPKGKIGKFEMTRLILGGNLIGGWAHARDLLYVSSLFKAYNTEKKVYETLILAEQAGIDTINIGFISGPLMAKYKKATGSKIKVISQVAPKKDYSELFTQLDQAIDYDADILQIQGNVCDWMVRDNRLDIIVKMLDRIKSQGYIAGLGAHTIDSFIICEENGIVPDYYMKTMHHDNYWSAHPRENRKPFEVDGTKSLDHNMFHDNCFCPFPDRTVEFVNKTKVPVMGFKVLAAGAIKPEDGFRWAFKNGADFICVGMFDFQIVNDVNIALDVLKNLTGRQRSWYA